MKNYRKHFIKFLTALLIFAFISCSKKEEQTPQTNSGKDFSWKQELKISDIPETPLKGFINGKEIKFDYINFEQWRGSGDNVLNFGDVKPGNNCGFVESDNSFHLIRKGGEISKGELLKSSFEQNLDGYAAYYNSSKDSTTKTKATIQWNCALVITSMDDKTVKGKIIMCFKDEMKSWLAGTFEAIRCYN
ncbi:MAG: hypothetical protein ABI462_03040 [Ignavibacteria bacterium]